MVLRADLKAVAVSEVDLAVAAAALAGVDLVEAAVDSRRIKIEIRQGWC